MNKFGDRRLNVHRPYKRTPDRGETTHHYLESTIVARNIP